MKNEHAIRTLNRLIVTACDSALGFDSCAQHAHDDQLRRILQDRARECADAARELGLLVRQLGGTPEPQGAAAGAAHRGWTGLRSALALHNDAALLEECERAEDYALERYRDAIDGQLPELVRRIVMRQFEGAMSNHDQLRMLRNESRARAQPGETAGGPPRWM